MTNRFIDTLDNSKIILTEGAMVERIRRNPALAFDPHIAHSGLVYNAGGRKALERIYREYIDIAIRHGFPMISLAPTWRANPERIEKSDFRGIGNINGDCVAFLKGIVKCYGDGSKSIFIGGMMGCKGDAYRPEEALSKKEAANFHRTQAESLAKSGVDFIKAATLPAFSEAYGIAKAVSVCRLPYVLSFVVRPDGSLLDGTPIHQAVETIDAEIDPAPTFYMINCVHPFIFEKAVGSEIGKSESVLKRLIGFQANTSEKSPDELEGLDHLDTTTPEKFAALMVSVHQKFGTKVMGGCCGTDGGHIAELAAKFSELTD